MSDDIIEQIAVMNITVDERRRLISFVKINNIKTVPEGKEYYKNKKEGIEKEALEIKNRLKEDRRRMIQLKNEFNDTESYQMLLTDTSSGRSEYQMWPEFLLLDAWDYQNEGKIEND